MKLVVVSPHRDDAAFSVGLSVRAWLQAGHAVEVMNCFTRSEYALYSDADSVHANDRMSFVTALRKREDECWSKLYGGKLSLTDLRLKDAPIRFRCSLEQVCEVAVRPDEKAFAKIISAVSATRAAVVMPLGIGSHVDHRTARDAALSALDASAPYAFYEDLPYAASADTAAAERMAEEIADRHGRTLSAVLVSEERSPQTNSQEAIDAALSRKRTFALCYDSQVSDGVVAEIAEFARRYGGRERLWVNAAWLQSELGLLTIGA